MTIIDISLPVHPGMPIYPGNQPVTFQSFKKPSGSQLTNISLDSHTGTHIDAPSHAGLSDHIGSYSLERFYGPCRVIEIKNIAVIEPKDLEGHTIGAGERILFKTDNSDKGFATMSDNWTALSSAAAQFLADKGVWLVGIDWFGIKQKGATDNGAHTALLEKGIPILEGLDLSQATAGAYTLAALPVAFQGIDGALARAVLVTNNT